MSTQNTSEVLLATREQVGHIQDLLGPKLRSLSRDTAQAIITNGGLFQERTNQMIDAVINELSSVITRIVKVNRNRSPKAMVTALGCAEDTDNSVVKSIPKGDGDEATVVFFKLDRWVSNDELALEYQIRGLIPDPYAQAAVNKADPVFWNNHRNSTHWKDEKGRWCYISFTGIGLGRRVSVNHDNGDWRPDRWFGGVCKPAGQAGESR